MLAGGALILALLFSGLVAWRVGVPLLRFASRPEDFRLWVDGHGLWGRLAYVGMVILQVIIALLPGEPFELAAGYAFGAVEGTALCIAASTLGSLLVFLLVRRFGIRLAEVFFPPEKLASLSFLKTDAKRNYLFFLIFMIPGTPKDLLCYFAGLTDMRITTWLLISSVGRIPAILTSTLGGDALGTKNYLFAALVFAATLLVSAAGLLIYRLICKRHKN